MKREEKQQIIDELTVLFGSEQNYYLADASGLNAAQVSDLRRLCFSKGIQLKVAKNTLISKALQAQTADLSSVESILKGPTAIFVSEDMRLSAVLMYSLVITNWKHLPS
jgi:large subunit ribosomal protein L10